MRNVRFSISNIWCDFLLLWFKSFVLPRLLFNVESIILTIPLLYLLLRRFLWLLCLRLFLLCYLSLRCPCLTFLDVISFDKVENINFLNETLRSSLLHFRRQDVIGPHVPCGWWCHFKLTLLFLEFCCKILAWSWSLRFHLHLRWLFFLRWRRHNLSCSRLCFLNCILWNIHCSNIFLLLNQ